MELNYFTCTLGEAAIHQKTDSSFESINAFIEGQALRIPDKPAVGFYTPSSTASEAWQTRVLTYSDVQRGSLVVADILSRAAQQGLSSSNTVALLCPSTAEFLFVWLALLRLGHSVLLIAPQLAPKAIAHLCKECGVSSLLYDEVYQDLAKGTGKHIAAEHGTEFWIFSIESVMGPEGVFTMISNEPHSIPQMPETDSNDTAFFFHTSGTSTGLPKPIPQTHYAAVGVLPRLTGSNEATFTTTPLYHGGISDLFRAWSSDATIWLFPGKDVPITASTILHCLDAARQATTRHESPPVKYFTGVPYVLQIMESDVCALEQLKCMDIVGVGGAALPDEVGQRLVKRGVNLVSRFGSAECGFLMSSHRRYSQDHDWQYLRDYTGAALQQEKVPSGAAQANGERRTVGFNDAQDAQTDAVITFESRDDGLSELVVLPAWPHRAKTNRLDGSYATSDLFEPHPTIPNAWRYHSRADAQLTLITGKKFDPAPLESAIAAVSASISDVFIFGDSQPYPGALIFRSAAAREQSDEYVLAEVVPAIEKLNSDGQTHTRLNRQMILPMPYDEVGLEKSSKGTLIRNKVTERYSRVIAASYDRMEGSGEEVPDDEVQQYILKSVRLLHVGRGSSGLTEDTDLHAYGLDSVGSIQLRRRLSLLISSEKAELPFSIVEDLGTVKRLSDYIVRRRHGVNIDEEDNEQQLMLDLVEKYSQFEPSTETTPEEGGTVSGEQGRGYVVLLTGATGALGAHVLHLYRQDDNVSKVYCLVRGADSHAAKERVSKALSERGLPSLTGTSFNNNKIEVLQCQLSDRLLGLTKEDYTRISRSVNVIVHLAWAVNFRMRLRHFEREHIAGTRNLINLIRSSPNHNRPTFVFCSSTASCTGLAQSKNQAGSAEDISTVVTEDFAHGPQAASAIGYGRSKWVTEQICLRSSPRSADAANSHEGAVRMAVLRVGQLAGDTERGVWNGQEAWPMMLQSAKVTGALPSLQNQPLDWLPVDVAAKAVIEAGEVMRRGDEKRIEVYHVLNPARDPTWIDLLGWIGKKQSFEILDPELWVEKLEGIAKKDPDNPALRLLGLWKTAYSGRDATAANQLLFATERTKDALPVLRSVRPVDEAYFGKIWQWLQKM